MDICFSVSADLAFNNDKGQMLPTRYIYHCNVRFFCCAGDDEKNATPKRGFDMKMLPGATLQPYPQCLALNAPGTTITVHEGQQRELFAAPVTT